MLFAATIMVALAAVMVRAKANGGGHDGGMKPGRFIDFAFTLDGECEVERPRGRRGRGPGDEGDDEVVGPDDDVKRRGVETDEFGELVDKRGRGGFQRRGPGKKPEPPRVDFDLREVVSQLEENRDLSNAVIGVQINEEQVCEQAGYLSRQSLEVCFEIDPCDLPRPVQDIFRPDRPERDGPRDGAPDAGAARKRATDDEMRVEGAQLASLLATALLGNTVDVRVPPEAMSVRQPMGLNSNVRRGEQQKDENKGKGDKGRVGRCRPVVLCADVLAAETPFVQNLRAGTLTGIDACKALVNNEATGLHKRSTEGIDIGEQGNNEAVDENFDVNFFIPNFDGIMDTFQEMETNTDEDGAEMMGMIITWFAGSFGIFDEGDEQAQVAVADATDDAGATLFEFVCNTLNLPCDSLPADLFGGDANRRRTVQGEHAEQGGGNKRRRRQLGVRASVRFCQRVIEDINGGFVAGQCCPFDFATLAGSDCDFDFCCAPQHQGFHINPARRRGEPQPKYGYIGPEECATECGLVDCGCGDAQCCGLGHRDFGIDGFEWEAPHQCRQECRGHDCDRLHDLL